MVEPEQVSEITPELVASDSGPDGFSTANFASGRIEKPAEPPTTKWLRTSSSSATAEVARRLISQATREFNVGASLSAETSAWEAIRWAAEAVDLTTRETPTLANQSSETALKKLEFAREAIREARDFAGTYGAVNSEAIARMAKSHVTNVLDDETTAGLSATDAADRYLDAARTQLAQIAASSVEAAQAMDLLAAVYLTRADAKTLPSSTALCLRRAALQGQPNNASLASRLGMHLADVGLIDEARWALEHSVSLDPDPETAEALVNVLRRSGQDDDAARLLNAMQARDNANFFARSDQSPASKQSIPKSRLVPSAKRSKIKIPEITQLSPADFAALSKPVMPIETPSTPTEPSLVNAKKKVIAVPASARINSADEPIVEDTNEKKPGVVRRFFRSLKSVW